MPLNQFEILNEWKISEEFSDKLLSNFPLNERLSEYYMRLSEEIDNENLGVKAHEIKNCGMRLFFDAHSNIKIYNLKSINFCKNRFCHNCQKTAQRKRLDRFQPHLLETSTHEDLFHCVFTVPNVKGIMLDTAVTCLFKAFSHLIRYFSGNVKLKGYSFEKYGFSAGIRSIEVTYDKKTFHPHLHVICAFKQGTTFEKNITNNFSYTKENGIRKHVRYFSEFELFLQRLWRLIYDKFYYSNLPKFGKPLTALPKQHVLYKYFNDDVAPGIKAKPVKITLSDVLSLGKNDGYSVIVDPIENNSFIQVFKYACKSQDDDLDFMTYEQFKYLHNALFNRHLIQGYGAWHNLKDEDDDYSDVPDKFFKVFEAYLWHLDYPDSLLLSPGELKQRQKEGNVTFISGSKFVRSISEDEQQSFIDENSTLPEPSKRSYALENLSYAYSCYVDEINKSTLFDTVEEVQVDQEEKPRVVLTAEQLNFFNDVLEIKKWLGNEII